MGAYLTHGACWPGDPPGVYAPPNGGACRAINRSSRVSDGEEDRKWRGCPSLAVAAHKGHAQIAATPLDAGAGPELASSIGDTAALAEATEQGHEQRATSRGPRGPRLGRGPRRRPGKPAGGGCGGAAAIAVRACTSDPPFDRCK